MNIISLATIKNQKNISKMQYSKYLAEYARQNIFNLKEIKTFILKENEDFDFFYKVNKPIKLNKAKDIYFSNSYDDILESYNDIVMAKGHIYKFKLYNIIYDNHNLNDISAYDKQEIKQVIKNNNKILLEIIDLYNYLKDEMILYSEEFSSELGIKKSYIVLDSEENIKELINKNKIIIVKASKEALEKAIFTTRNDIESKTLKEKKGWTSLNSAGHKSFKLYTDAYESYNKFKYENNYTEGLKMFLKTHKEQEIKEVIPELTNTKGNLINERIGCFIKLYDDLDKNKDYYKILKEAVYLKTETKEKYEKVHNLNSKEAKEEVNNKIKTKALYIAKENMDSYILSSIKSKMIKRYIMSKDIKTPMMLKRGSEKVLDVSKNEYIKSLDLSELKKKIAEDEDLNNLEEYFYYFNDESPKEELSTLLIDKFNFHKDNVHLFMNNILNSEYYLTGNHDGISNIIKIIENKGYLFITYNEFSNRLEDDLFKCLRHRDIGFEEVKEHIEEYSLVFNLDKIDELITSDDLREIFGPEDRLLNLKEELQKSDEEDFSYMVPACEEILKDHNLINEMLNSALFSIKDMEFLFEHYKKLNGIKESVKLNDFFNIKLGRSFITQEFAMKEEYSLKNGEYQGISVKVKFMSEKEYADKCKEMENIESLEEFTDYLIPKYYGENLNYEEKKESLIKIQNMCNKITEVTSLYKDSGIIDPFLYRIIKSNKSLKDIDNENKVNDYDHHDTNIILGYSQKSILHSASLEESDNLSLAHDIFQILTGAKVENGHIIGGCQIAVSLNTSKSTILPLYINAICNNIQSGKEAEYINNLFKNHMIFENENIKKVNGRYKLIENLKEYYSEADITKGFEKIIDDIMNSFINLKMKDSINEIKVDHAGMVDICLTKDSGRDRFNKNAELNYESLQDIDLFMDNIYKQLNSYFKNNSHKPLEIINSMKKRYLDYMLQNEGFIYNMEQCANLNITLIAQNAVSRYDSEMLYDNDIIGEDICEHNEITAENNYEHNKNEYEKNIKAAEIKNIRLNDAITEKGYIMPEEISNVFKDTIIKDGYAQKVNAYRINIENMQLDNPLYKDLFSKDINNKYVYEHLCSNYDPKQYVILHNIKPKICEIIIPAFKSKDLEEDLYCNLKNLKKKSAILINTLYKLDKYNFKNLKLDIEKEIFVSKKRKNEVHEDNSLIKFKKKAEKKLGDYYESLIYEMTSSNGYFKRSLKSPIENSANLKISNVASPIKDNDGNYAAHMFKKAINDHKYHGIHYVNPKDIFGENYKIAYRTIGKQLITDNIDKSDEFYKYMKNNFISSAVNTHDIHKKGESLLKDHSILEKIGEGYLKEIGISSVLISDRSPDLQYIQCVKTYINSSISKGSTYIDYVTAHKFHNNEIRAFFEGIRKSKNGKYFLRSNEETQDICNIMKVSEDDNYKEFEKSLNEDKLYKNHEHAKQKIKIYDNYSPLYETMDRACEKLIGEDNLNNKGIFKEVYSRNYVEDAPTIDEKKVLKGSKIYSVNIEDAGLFKVLDILRNKKGNAELKLQDIQSSKVKRIQEKSFDKISKKINYYKIAIPNKTDESILNEIKDSIKKEYINDFSKSFEIIDKVFNNIQLDNSINHNKAFKEIRKEYDKDKVNDYINTMMVLKNKNMITKEEITNIAEKIKEQLKKTGPSKKEFKENFCNILKKSRKFKERNIDTLPKVEKFLSDVITKENIEDVKTMEEIQKAQCHFRINIIEAEDILNEEMQSIIKNLPVKNKNTYEIGKDIVKTYVKHIQEEDKSNEQILNYIYNKNAHNQEFIEKALNINMNSTKDLESIKKVKIGYGTYAGLAIGELSHKSLNKILKKDYSNKLNYKVNEKLLKKTKNAINKAKHLDYEGIINKEGKLIAKEKLKSFLGNSYINKIQKKIKGKGSHRRKETNMYKEASQAIKSAFTGNYKDSHKALIMRKYSNTGKALSLSYSEQNINIEPDISPKPKENTQRLRESIKSRSPNYESIPTSNARYYEQETTGNAINISAQSTSKSTVNNMSQIISKALGGSNLNINTNYIDSRSIITHDEISSMIENSMK